MRPQLLPMQKTHLAGFQGDIAGSNKKQHTKFQNL